MLYLHLFNGTKSSAKTSDLGEFLLDFLQPILTLAVSKVVLRVGPGLTAIPLVQFLKLHDLNTQGQQPFRVRLRGDPWHPE